MAKKSNFFAIIISVLFFLIFLLSGCEKTMKVQESNQNRISVKEAKSLMTPQYELIESDQYKKLKQNIETIRIEVDEIKNRRDKLLTIYTDEYVAKQKISKDLKEAEKKLNELKSLLSAEEDKLEKRVINFPV